MFDGSGLAWHIESIFGNVIFGWARYTDEPERLVVVELVAGDEIVEYCVANEKQNNTTNSGDDKQYYFRLKIPDFLSDGKPHALSIKDQKLNKIFYSFEYNQSLSHLQEMKITDADHQRQPDDQEEVGNEADVSKYRAASDLPSPGFDAAGILLSALQSAVRHKDPVRSLGEKQGGEVAAFDDNECRDSMEFGNEGIGIATPDGSSRIEEDPNGTVEKSDDLSITNMQQAPALSGEAVRDVLSQYDKLQDASEKQMDSLLDCAGNMLNAGCEANTKPEIIENDVASMDFTRNSNETENRRFLDTESEVGAEDGVESVANEINAAPGEAPQELPKDLCQSSACTEIEFNIEIVSDTMIQGWAWRPNAQDQRVVLELVVEDEAIVFCTADDFREDLLKHGKGDGCCSFALSIPMSIMTGDVYRLSIRDKQTGFVLLNIEDFQSTALDKDVPLECCMLADFIDRQVDTVVAHEQSSKSIESVALSTPNEEKQEDRHSFLAEGDVSCGFLSIDLPQHPFAYELEWNIDIISEGFVRGWVWCPAEPDCRVLVDFIVDDYLVKTVVADIFRNDLLYNGKGDGKYGFYLHMPISIQDGKVHGFRLDEASTKTSFFTFCRFQVTASSNAASPL